MRDYIYLLLWIVFLYYFSWHYTGWRKESALITVNKSITKILFYLKSSNRISRRISVFSIIMGFFAHFSLIFFLILVLFNNVTAPYMKLILRIWFFLGLSIGTVGEIIETYIKIKRAEVFSEKRDLLILIILLVFSTGVMVCMTVKYSLILSKLLLM